MGKKLKIGDAVIEMQSYEDGKCIYFGKARCIHQKKGAKEKKKDKENRCDGYDSSCKIFLGSSPFVPIYDEKYLLPPVESEILALSIANADNVLIAGSPGTGKSSLVLQLASIFNWGVVRYSCSEEISSSKIIGQWTVIGDTMEWVDGYIVHAMRSGFILLEDESDFMRPELRGEVHSLMEQGGNIVLTGVHPKTKKIFKEVVNKHPAFRWISTANTTGYGDEMFSFHGTQYMNAASRDRYEIILKFDYRPPEEEAAIIHTKTQLDINIVEKMIGVAKACRESIKDGMMFHFSIRRLLAWAKYYQKLSPEVACRLAVLNFCNSVDEHTVKSLIRTHMNVEIN